MKRKSFSLAVCCFVSVLTSCGGSTVDNSKLVIGMECSYQPFNWTVNEESEHTLPIDGTKQFSDGYDIAVAKYLSKELNKEVIIKKITWENLIPSILNDNINMILAGMSVTAKRKETIDFSAPYLSSDLAFLIKSENLPEGNSKDNPISYDNLLELFRGKNLICQSGVVGDDIIETYFSSKNDFNIKHNQPLQTYPLAAQDVKNGGAFAMPAELPVVSAMTNLDPGKLSVLYCDYKSFLSEDDLIGLEVNIGLKKGNIELKNEIDSALNKLSPEGRNKMMGEASIRSQNV